MSIRYAIDLVLEPAFTAKAYQTRQIVCGQYSSWAAEMQMLRMRLTAFFPCPEERLPLLESRVESIAADARSQGSFLITRAGIAAAPAMNGVALEFQDSGRLTDLQRRAAEAAGSVASGENAAGPFRPQIPLLEYGAFPEAMLPDAAEFAAGVARELEVAEMARPWRLLLTRYLSDAAGDDWSGGRWAADLSWRQLRSCPLNGEDSAAKR